MQWLDNLLGLTAENLEWYQMVLRALIVYIVALGYIRIAGMRTFGTTSAFDVVVTITIGAVLSQAVTGHRPFIPCLLAALTLALCHRVIAALTFRFNGMRKLVIGKPVLLFKEGVFLEKNLSLHSIQRGDLERTLREKGIDDYSNVRSIWYEVDGKISVVMKEK